jgi:hypothetical protein
LPAIAVGFAADASVAPMASACLCDARRPHGHGLYRTSAEPAREQSGVFFDVYLDGGRAASAAIDSAGHIRGGAGGSRNPGGHLEPEPHADAGTIEPS